MMYGEAFELYVDASDCSQTLAMLETGGNTASPTRSTAGSITCRNARAPSRALFMSVQAGSGRPSLVVHMDDERSMMTITSSGRAPHGEHAVARALMSKLPRPTTRAKNVCTVVDSRTVIAFTGLQGAAGRQRSVVDVVTSGISGDSFLPPPPLPYWTARLFAAAPSGSSSAAAVAAASADAWRDRFT